jgi:DNA-binding transcriptional LysR family regulator
LPDCRYASTVGRPASRRETVDDVGSHAAYVLDGVSVDQLRTFIAALPMVEADLASGALVRITLEDTPPGGHVVVMSAAYRKDIPPAPAVRWFIDHLKQEDARRLYTNTLRLAVSIPTIPERRPMWSRPPIEKQQSS